MAETDMIVVWNGAMKVPLTEGICRRIHYLTDEALDETETDRGHNYRRKLTAADATQIRARHRAGDILCTLAADYGVSEDTVRDVVRRRSWAHAD